MSRKKKNDPRKENESLTTPSNLLSIVRMLLVLPLVILFDDPRGNQLLIAGLGFFAYLTDLADGWLARNFGGESKLGRLLDPLADKVFISAVVLLMIVTRMIPLWFGIIVIARDVLIFLGGLYLRKRTGVIVQSNMLGKAAVVGIGVVLVIALFSDGGTNVVLTLFMTVTLGLIVASLYVYAERFFKILKQHRGTR
ncbi:MAG: CDP-alcohol phosphatidyltransferase family protein [Bacteroidetes bacterium]|nr:CDP-alcohol phosphatidyltransferase family protein [Bacteroidota bacterium]